MNYNVDKIERNLTSQKRKALWERTPCLSPGKTLLLKEKKVRLIFGYYSYINS